MSVLSKKLVGFREKSHINFLRQQCKSDQQSRMLMSCDFGQTLGEAAVPEAECGPCLRRSVDRAPSLHYTLTFALTAGKKSQKKTEKTTVRVKKKVPS